MANIAKWMLDLIGNPKTAKFVDTLKHSDLPKNWANDPEIVGLAERAYQQGGTESPFFKAYFQGSKAVDDSGKPLPLYHITDKKFDSFDMSKARQNMDIPAAYFSSGKDDWGDMGDNVIEAYLNLKNPVYGKPSVNGKGLEVKEGLIKKGYDGAITPEEDMETEFAAFFPNQIKALKNRGTFNPDDPNIYRALAPVGVGLGTLAAAGMVPDTEASAKSAYINSPEMKAAMMGIHDEPVKEAWNPVEALATAPIGAFTTGARAASVGIDALLSALLGD